MRTGSKRGFTLVESVAAVGMVSLLLGVMAPAVKQTRVAARGQSSAANLAQIGQLSGMYAVDHGGLIHTYTWRGPRDGSSATFLLPDGRVRSANNDSEAAAFQETEILMRATGRIDGVDRLQVVQDRLSHRRRIGLVLTDYAGRPFPDPLFVDPSDALHLQWAANPLDASAANLIPYSGGDYTGYDKSNGWTTLGVRQRWAFSSSYQSSVFAWQPDTPNELPALSPTICTPTASTPHLFPFPYETRLAEGRNYAEVTFPSAKVHYFEEFDREQPGSPYFAYDHARPAKLMFDGSVNEWASGFASASADPLNPNPRWRQNYVPLHQFPVPLSGLGEQTLLSQRYRWTYRGLKGLDYPLMSPKDAVAR